MFYYRISSAATLTAITLALTSDVCTVTMLIIIVVNSNVQSLDNLTITKLFFFSAGK
jgi:metal-sulfur cluster biosynthetic enzyme